jgi:SET domain-containing protein
MPKGLVVAPCDVGLGVFALRRFREGERLVRFNGTITDRLDPIHHTPDGANLLQIGRERYLYPRPTAIYVNHSCRPNAGLRGTRTLVALRDIEPGEEIRFDYSTSMDEELWTMQCACGHSDCRGVIGDFKYLAPELQERYIAMGIVPRFVAGKRTARR